MASMHRIQIALLTVVVYVWSSDAMAQFGGATPDGSSPTFSPYLNLLRGGNSGVGMNYFGLVRPQQEFAQQNQALGQSLQSLQMQSNGMPISQGGYGYSQLGMTGHPVIFNSFGTSRFSGGYTGFGTTGFGGGAGNFGGGQFGGGQSFGNQFGGNQFGGIGGVSQFGGQSNFGGIGTAGGGFGGFNGGGVSGHMSQFGGIGNTYRQGR